MGEIGKTRFHSLGVRARRAGRFRTRLQARGRLLFLTFRSTSNDLGLSKSSVETDGGPAANSPVGLDSRQMDGFGSAPGVRAQAQVGTVPKPLRGREVSVRLPCHGRRAGPLSPFFLVLKRYCRVHRPIQFHASVGASLCPSGSRPVEWLSPGPT